MVEKAKVPCKWCGTFFVPYNTKHLYCQRKCKNTFNGQTRELKSKRALEIKEQNERELNFLQQFATDLNLEGKVIRFETKRGSTNE